MLCSFSLRILICEKTVGNIGTSCIVLKFIQSKFFPPNKSLIWNTLWNLESCFLIIQLFIPKKAKVCLLQLDPLRVPATYAVVPSSGKRAYCFAVDLHGINTNYKNICVCVWQQNRYTAVREMWTLFENIKEMIFF